MRFCLTIKQCGLLLKAVHAEKEVLSRLHIERQDDNRFEFNLGAEDLEILLLAVEVKLARTHTVHIIKGLDALASALAQAKNIEKDYAW